MVAYSRSTNVRPDQVGRRGTTRFRAPRHQARPQPATAAVQEGDPREIIWWWEVAADDKPGGAARRAHGPRDARCGLPFPNGPKPVDKGDPLLSLLQTQCDWGLAWISDDCRATSITPKGETLRRLLARLPTTQNAA